MRLILPALVLLSLAACASKFEYALTSRGYPIPEPPCCHSAALATNGGATGGGQPARW